MLFHIIHNILQGFFLFNVHTIADILFVLPVVHHLGSTCTLGRLFQLQFDGWVGS
jgi:hypothetical protein